MIGPFARIALLCLTFLPFSLMGQDSRLKGLDQELEAVLSTWKAPGFALGVVEKDRVVYAKGFGFRDVEKQLPLTPSTLFAIGSCRKAFTAAILRQLEEEEKFSFDERPATYIPDFRFQESSLNEQVKVEDLVTHRTGLPRHDFSWYLFLPDQPEYELAPTGEHRFAIRSLSGYYLEFETNDSGNVNAVLFQQPNGTFRAEKQVE